VRAAEESAEAVVVKKAEETRKERRAEEPAEGDQPTDCGRMARSCPKQRRTSNYGRFLCW
jgi:hypothetical protein